MDNFDMLEFLGKGGFSTRLKHDNVLQVMLHFTDEGLLHCVLELMDHSITDEGLLHCVLELMDHSITDEGFLHCVLELMDHSITDEGLLHCVLELMDHSITDEGLLHCVLELMDHSITDEGFLHCVADLGCSTEVCPRRLGLCPQALTRGVGSLWYMSPVLLNPNYEDLSPGWGATALPATPEDSDTSPEAADEPERLTRVFEEPEYLNMPQSSLPRYAHNSLDNPDYRADFMLPATGTANSSGLFLPAVENLEYLSPVSLSSRVNQGGAPLGESVHQIQ
ncbi:hypothetical protein CRUP_036873 [Coryphaenoides rupestris]|nr:hypothetical protein CRUP_036873 [Coryphaenoides rupestris]